MKPEKVEVEKVEFEPKPDPEWVAHWRGFTESYPIGSELILLGVRLRVLRHGMAFRWPHGEWSNPKLVCMYLTGSGELATVEFDRQEALGNFYYARSIPQSVNPAWNSAEMSALQIIAQKELWPVEKVIHRAVNNFIRNYNDMEATPNKSDS